MKIFDEQQMDDLKSDCHHYWIPIDGYYTCTTCGCVDTTRNAFIERSPSFYRKFIHIYKRRAYFIERLYLMNDSPEYIKMLNFFKTQKFKSIHELKRLVKNIT